MTRLLYWLVYNVDLGPFGPALLDLAVRTWLGLHRARLILHRARQIRADADWASALAWTPR